MWERTDVGTGTVIETDIENGSGAGTEPAADAERRGEGGLEALEHLPTGTFLALMLDSIDRTQHNGHDLVYLIRARVREISRLQAELFSDIVELAHCPPSGPGDPPRRQQVMDEFCSDELRAALSWTRRHADSQVDLGWRLVERLPAVWEALAEGLIDMARARVIVYGTDHLDEALAREVADRVLGRAAEMSTGQLGAALRRLCIDTDPDDAARRYATGVEERRVVAEPNPDGTADLLGLSLPADRVAAIVSRIAAMARARRRRHEPRTLDQIKADVLLELLEGRSHSHSPRPNLDITVDLTTLIGLDDRAGEIPGWGPVIADIARQAVERQPDGTWRVRVTDPDSGAVLHDGTTRRRPRAAQRRHVEARQPVCAYMTCRQPATRCDLDHEIDWARGGPTLVPNLQPLCRHEQDIKHRGGWRVTHLGNGRYRWISRHGHLYETGPPP